MADHRVLHSPRESAGSLARDLPWILVRDQALHCGRILTRASTIGQKISGRSIEVRTSINKNSDPWQCLVKIGNLDPAVTRQQLKTISGTTKLRNLNFSKPSYDPDDTQVATKVKDWLAKQHTPKAWTLPQGQMGGQRKAVATFQSRIEAQDVVRLCNTWDADFFGFKNTLHLSHIFKAKLTTLFHIFEFFKTAELPKELRRIQKTSPVRIKAYPIKDNLVTLQLISPDLTALGKVKAVIGRFLGGHVAKSGSDILWHDHFANREGRDFLNTMNVEHGVFVLCEKNKRTLKLYGIPEKRAVVESLLINAVKDLSLIHHTVELDETLSRQKTSQVYRQLVSDFGASSVKVDLARTPRVIILDGPLRDAGWAKMVLKRVINSSGPREIANDDPDGSNTCGVCLCEPGEDAYTTICGHVYDKECFADQCSNAETFPIRCLGGNGTCNKIIPILELEMILSRVQFEDLLTASFDKHINTHLKEYHHCPTPLCETIYAVTKKPTIYMCKNCLTSICTTCTTTSHEGISCDENKRLSEREQAFQDWKRDTGAKGNKTPFPPPPSTPGNTLSKY